MFFVIMIFIGIIMFFINIVLLSLIVVVGVVVVVVFMNLILIPVFTHPLSVAIHETTHQQVLQHFAGKGVEQGP
jgi:hypothetical protein